MTAPALRRWQALFLDRHAAHPSPDFLLVATPGAGKTLAAALAVRAALDAGRVHQVVVVCPTTALRAQWADAADRAGLILDPRWRNADGRWRSDAHGVVVTYQQVASAPDLFAHHLAVPTAVVLDECHHCGRGGDVGDGAAHGLHPAPRSFGHAVSLGLARDPLRHSDDPGVHARIARYAAAAQPRWIVAVGMVSEGEDIPRLAVAVYATVRRTELFFRQAIGRVVRRRTRDPDDLNATVYLPADPTLVAFAHRVELELRHELRDSDPDALDVEPPTGATRKVDFDALDAHVESGGMIVAGARYSREEVVAARRLLRELGQSDARCARCWSCAARAGRVRRDRRRFPDPVGHTGAGRR